MVNRVTAAVVVLAAPVAVLAGCSNSQTSSEKTSGSSTTSAGAQTIKADLKSADGKTVANATIDFTSGYATVTVETVSGGTLSPGSHGMHIHSVGKCEAAPLSRQAVPQATSTPPEGIYKWAVTPGIRPAVI